MGHLMHVMCHGHRAEVNIIAQQLCVYTSCVHIVYDVVYIHVQLLILKY